MRRFAWSTVALLLFVLVPMAPAQNGLESCGEGLELFIRNPDIQADTAGVFTVSGKLLVQFQVIGDRADEIEAFGLSFGYDIPTGDEVCAAPSPALWVTGAYLEAYSLDTKKSDGFFIAINSNGQTSPQGDLGVAVHGYDASGNELARFWGAVRNDNCGNPPSLGCPGAPEAAERDVTMPWPIILPGDGIDAPVNGFIVEFNEPLSDYTIELNGDDITDQMTEWTNRPNWDQDYYIGGPQLVLDRIAAQCTLPDPVHQCGPLSGPALQWTDRPVDDDDIIRVVATDMNGNQATKEIHIGSSVAGGTIADGLPVLQMTFDASTVEVEAGQEAVFRMTMDNNGGGEGHPFASADVPEGWNYEWVPGHEPVPAGGSSTQDLFIQVPANATAGRHPIRAVIDYRQGSDDKSLESALHVLVLEPKEVFEAEPLDEENESPAPGAWLGLLAVLALGFVARRRKL